MGIHGGGPGPEEFVDLEDASIDGFVLRLAGSIAAQYEDIDGQERQAHQAPIPTYLFGRGVAGPEPPAVQGPTDPDPPSRYSPLHRLRNGPDGFRVVSGQLPCVLRLGNLAHRERAAFFDEEVGPTGEHPYRCPNPRGHPQGLLETVAPACQ